MTFVRRSTPSQSLPKNRWAERREDYALRYVPERYRQWGWASLTGVMVGVATAMFFLAWGGQLITSYGTIDLFYGMLFGTVFIGGLAFIFATIASRTGLDSDLITRGAGFGFLGSAITSLIYSFNFLMFFAFEGTIMATAIHSWWPVIPNGLIYIAIGFVFLPLTWWGITVINWLMWVTIPIYLGLLAWAIILAATNGVHVSFWSYQPAHPVDTAAGPAILQVLAAVMALISQATIAADIGRFIPRGKNVRGAIAVGFISQLITFLFLTMLGGWFTLRLGHSTNPGSYLTKLLGIWGVLLVVITQIRINVSNVYSGSLAYTNFFCRVFHYTPGRHYWVVLTAILGTLLMFGGIFTHLIAVLTFEGVFVMAWVMTIVADITINKLILGVSPKKYLYKRAQLYRFNPVGVGAMLLALAISLPFALGFDGAFGKSLAPFISGAVAFAFAPIIAVITKGKYYVASTVGRDIIDDDHSYSARMTCDSGDHDSTTECVKCTDRFDSREFVQCPFLRGPICSVCCSSEARCGEMCKGDALNGR